MPKSVLKIGRSGSVGHCSDDEEGNREEEGLKREERRKKN